MEKLTGQVMVHLSEAAERQIKRLAEIEGDKAGEYVRGLIMAHLAEKERQFQLMSEVFGDPQKDR